MVTRHISHIKRQWQTYMFCRWDVQENFKVAIEKTRLLIKSQIIWDKIIHGMGDLTGEFSPRHETMLYATKGRYEFAGKRPTTIFQAQRVLPEQLIHPNEKPVKLMCQLIETLTSLGDIILDPFCGSGTTCVAAKILGRRYIGIDISPEYCEIARMRLKAVDTGVPVKEQKAGQMALFESEVKDGKEET